MSKIIDYKNSGFENVNFNDGSKLAQLEDLLGMKISTVQKPNTGKLNKVAILRENNTGNSAVLKVSPLWNSHGLAREKWGYSQVKKFTKLRIAQILSYLPQSNDIFPGHELLAVEYISGRLITSAELLMKEFNRKISLIFQEIHGIQNIQGFGWLNENFSGEHNDWHNFLGEIDNVNLVLENKLLPDSEISWLIAELRGNTKQKPTTSFLYGDFNRENLIINDGDIVPIDFQNCFVGDSLYDLGIGLFFNPEIYSHLSEYGEYDRKSLKIIILYAMRHSISTMGHRSAVKDGQAVEEAITRYRQLKKLYCFLS